MITFREAKDTDIDWAFKIKSEAEFHFVEEHFGWDDDFQGKLHAQEWRKTLPYVVEYMGIRVGFYSIEPEGDKFFLRRFFVSKEYRNLGIGSAVIGNLLSEFQAIDENLWLAVFKGNPAKKLYLKHGFEMLKTTQQYEYMCWTPKNM
jgi:ribosomal protein S18 acetylase RimI-like enzyme